MAARNEIIAFLDELLDPDAFQDYSPNGLQVPGAEDVSMVATGVSAHLELFELAAAQGAQMVLCHHGLFWSKEPRRLDERRKARLKALFDADLSLAAYHLPLDAHPEVGNNALICAGLGLELGEPFDVGYVGRAPEPIARDELVARCERLFERPPLAFANGPDPVRSVGVISGGAASSLGAAVERGLDAFITGEPSEQAMAESREAGITFIAGGHWATETFGVKRLGQVLEDRFGVEHRFIAVPNPV